jgi:hypothetical protein
MSCMKSPRVSASLRSVALAAFTLAVLFSSSAPTLGAAFSANNFALGGDPKTAAYPNVNSNFFRWEQSQITYAFAQSFIDNYGLAGEARVTTAFGTWTASLAAANGPADQSAAYNPVTDISIKGAGDIYDFQSVALHEIGHAIGFDHPDAASGNGANNYNVAAGDWVNGALPGASHPVMTHDIAPSLERQVLTKDDILAAQFLYANPAGNAAPGAGVGPAAGPIFGNTPRGLNFVDITANGNPLLADILIEAVPIGGNTLARTRITRDGVNFGTFAAVGGFTYTRATNATLMDIQFNIPEPSSVVLAIIGGIGFVVVAIRKRK